MEEFEQLIAEAKKYRIEIMLDMVLNHVSTEHEWFKSTSRGPALSGLLHFKRRANGLGIKICGSAWSPFGDTGKYYLHLYDRTQADLNWRNQAVREELFKVVRFGWKRGKKDSVSMLSMLSVKTNN